MAILSRKQLDEIERNLGSWRPEDQNRALHTLWTLPDPISTIEDILKRQQRLRRSFAAVTWATFLLAVGAAIIGFRYGHRSSFADRLPVVGLLLIAGWKVCQLRVVSATDIHRNIADALSRVKDERVLGMLLELHSLPGMQRSVRDYILSRLQELGPSDADQLNRRQRSCLYACLQQRDYPLQSTVLNSLLQIDSVAAIPHLELLIRREGEDTWDEKLKVQAKDVLVVLHQRVDRLRESGTLVRPAEGTNQEQILVRPAQNTGVSEPALLVRPSRRDETSD